MQRVTVAVCGFCIIGDVIVVVSSPLAGLHGLGGGAETRLSEQREHKWSNHAGSPFSRWIKMVGKPRQHGLATEQFQPR